jgi:hypothetical protein
MGRDDIYPVKMSKVGCHCSGNRVTPELKMFLAQPVKTLPQLHQQEKTVQLFVIYTAQKQQRDK